MVLCDILKIDKYEIYYIYKTPFPIGCRILGQSLPLFNLSTNK